MLYFTTTTRKDFSEQRNERKIEEKTKTSFSHARKFVCESRERENRVSLESEREPSRLLCTSERDSLYTRKIHFFHLIDKGNLGKIENYLFCVCDNCNVTAVP